MSMPSSSRPKFPPRGPHDCYHHTKGLDVNLHISGLEALWVVIKTGTIHENHYFYITWDGALQSSCHLLVESREFPSPSLRNK